VYENGVLKYVLNEEGKLEETGYKYLIKDHLGNVRMTVGEGGAAASELNHYYPFGMRMMAMSETKPDTDQKYRYNGKELQEETEWLDYGWRMYNAALGRFHTQDRYAEDFSSWSPYHSANNNPILNIDIMGDSTFVSQNDNGTYSVTGGNLDNEDDKGIYMMGEDGAYVQVGTSITSNSFFDVDGNAVVGAVIEPNSTEGQDFIDNEIVGAVPKPLEYMANAKGGEPLDIKTRNIENRPEGTTATQYMYRSSVASDGSFGSARDFGNIGAGIIAGRNGMTWDEARTGFDGLQKIQERSFSAVEGQTTQKAQRIGYNIGVTIRNKEGRMTSRGYRKYR